MYLDIYFAGIFKAGEAGYYDGRKRGTVVVRDDNKLYLYYQPVNSMKQEFKIALKCAFCSNGEKLKGRYPSFSIK